VLVLDQFVQIQKLKWQIEYGNSTCAVPNSVKFLDFFKGDRACIIKSDELKDERHHHHHGNIPPASEFESGKGEVEANKRAGKLRALGALTSQSPNAESSLVTFFCI